MRVNRRRAVDDPGVGGKGKPKRNPTVTRHVRAGADAAQTENKRKKISTIITRRRCARYGKRCVLDTFTGWETRFGAHDEKETHVVLVTRKV